MKEIKILHLFPRLMSLYGEYGGLRLLERELRRGGFAVTVTVSDEGDVPFGDFDMIYVGSGTEEALLEGCRRLAPYADGIRAAVSGGKTLFLATGNAMALFGKTLTRGEITLEGMGAFGYDTVIEKKRYLGDALTTGENPFGAPCVGFVNTSCRFEGIDAPLLEMRLNPALGNDKKSPGEGIYTGNFVGTQLIGHLLVKNPHALGWVYEKLTGAEYTPDGESNQVKAYEVAVKELTARLEVK